MNIINKALMPSPRNPEFHELNPDFIKKHNYGTKVILDGYRSNEIQYISNVLNCKEGYNLYWLYEKGDEFSLKANCIEELLMNAIEKHASGADIIIEFIGAEVYLYDSEVEFYIIFGQKDKIKLIDDYEFSDERALKILDDLNKGRSDYYQWLYDTYQDL